MYECSQQTLFIIGKKWTHLKCLSTDEQINEMSSHTMKYYLVTKGMELMHATTWMKFENIILSKLTNHKRPHGI